MYIKSEIHLYLVARKRGETKNATSLRIKNLIRLCLMLIIYTMIFPRMFTNRSIGRSFGFTYLIANLGERNSFM